VTYQKEVPLTKRPAEREYGAFLPDAALVIEGVLAAALLGFARVG